jgi:hypothetical protein
MVQMEKSPSKWPWHSQIIHIELIGFSQINHYDLTFNQMNHYDLTLNQMVHLMT